MNPLEEAVTEWWGPRCPDYEPECPTCKAWHEYDATLDKLHEAQSLLKTCRATLNMAGYYDLVASIDESFKDKYACVFCGCTEKRIEIPGSYPYCPNCKGY